MSLKKQLNLLKKKKKMIRNKRTTRVLISDKHENFVKSKRSNSRFESLHTNLLNSKRSQLTIFIIVAIILVAMILLIFLLWRKPTAEISPETDPSAYIEQCAEEAAEEAIAILSENGGDIEPEGSVTYDGKEITYLCYNENYYKPCINQRPMLIEHIEQEITNYVEPKVEECFLSLRQELEDRKYDVSMGSMDITTELQTKKVIVAVKKKLNIRKNEDTRKFTEFKAGISHPIYDLAEIAMEVVNQEARYCNFDILGFMIIYPDYDADKIRLGDSNTIYILRDIPTGKEFTFAIRSCAMPAGL